LPDAFFVFNRGSEIRTHDLFHPKEARYQAALYPDRDATHLKNSNRRRSKYIMREEYSKPK
jgi:hypothetical protein